MRDDWTLWGWGRFDDRSLWPFRRCGWMCDAHWHSRAAW